LFAVFATRKEYFAMSLERHDLHDELVALIAAGRELPPEHDQALADIFLDHAQYRATSAQPAPSSLLTALQDWRVVAGALLLALTAFLFGTGFGQAAGPDGGFGDGYGHRWYQDDDGAGFQGGQWQQNWPPFQQVPSAPSAPSAPASPSSPGV
jgi:hypothetical protein